MVCPINDYYYILLLLLLYYYYIRNFRYLRDLLEITKFFGVYFAHHGKILRHLSLRIAYNIRTNLLSRIKSSYATKFPAKIHEVAQRLSLDQISVLDCHFIPDHCRSLCRTRNKGFKTTTNSQTF